MARDHDRNARYGQRQSGGGSGARSSSGPRFSGQTPANSGSADKCQPPYHFVPVEPDLAVLNEPLFHDEQHTGDKFWTGELHCELTALTPLLAGNYQFDCEHLSGNLQAEFQRLLAKYRVPGSPAPEKKVLEPLRLRETINGAPQPVVISGAALKGAIRNPLQALLAAPMERVKERTFSFRPNLGDSLRMRPAMVHSRRIENGRLVELQIEFATGGCDDIVYVRPDAEPALRKILAGAAFGYTEAAADLENLPIEAPRANVDDEVKGVSIDPAKRYAKKLRRGEPTDRADLREYFLLRYRGGLDGQGTFAESFDGKPPYRWALVKLPSKKSTLVSVPRPVLDLYSDTLQHISDGETGHLRAHPQHALDRNAVEANIRVMRNNCPQPGDMLYVEEIGGKIVGIGHHFRHRRLYRDSIHLSGDRSQTPQDRLRAVLCPGELECASQANGPHEGAPQQLTGARGLFGYVASDNYEKNPNQPLTFSVGKKGTDFEQLAGRISINWAVEQPREDGKERFLHEKDSQCLVPLRPLGEPKASAVETYLQQDPDKLATRNDHGTLCTYGDTLDDVSAGKLNGRKFYLHQPEAADPAKQRYELRPGSPDWSQTDGKGNTTYHIVGDQAMLARFVSSPGTRFRFSVRFRDLRAWELGALLLTLTADRPLIEHLIDKLGLKETPPKRLRTWLDRATGWESKAPRDPLLALKLGHGRPLGLGSVRVAVKEIRTLCVAEAMLPTAADHADETTVNEIRHQAVAALADQLRQQFPSTEQQARWAEQILLPWLQVHRYAGRPRYDYPRDTARKTNRQPTKTPPEPETIFNWHTNQRKYHAAGRKQAKPGGHHLEPGGLTSLDELDKLES